MARVSQRHLDARRQQILDAARRCFARNGFHATSMQDILAEAELSAGGLYRYFPSKDDIIIAIATDALSRVTGAFEEAIGSEALPPLDEVFGRVCGAIEALAASHGMPGLAVQVWAESLRSPSLAERVRQTFEGVRRLLVQLVEVYQARGMLPGDIPAEHIARTLAGILPGFVVQYAVLGDVNAAMFRDGLHALLASGQISADRRDSASPQPSTATEKIAP